MWPWRLILFSIYVSILTYFPIGYHSTITNVPQRLLVDFVNQSATSHYNATFNGVIIGAFFSIMVSFLHLGSVIGVIFAGMLSDRFGRAYSMLFVAGWLQLIGALLMGLARPTNAFELLIVGRLILGFAGGIARPIIYTYLVECSTTKFRGLVGMFPKLALSLGNVLGQLFGLNSILGNDSNWPWLMSLTTIVAALSIVSIFFVPESPKFLLIIKEDRERAEQAIRTLYSNVEEFERYLGLIEIEENKQKPISFLEILRNKFYRKCLALSIVILIARVSFAWPYISVYSTYIIGTVNISETTSQSLTVAMSLVSELCVLLALPIVHKLKRRPLYFYCSMISIVIFVLLTIFGALDISATWSSAIYVSLLFAICFVFNFGPGNTVNIIGAEILPLEIRATALSIDNGIVLFLIFVGRLLFYEIYELIGSYCYLIFATAILVSTVYLYQHLPETSNRPLNDILEDIEHSKVALRCCCDGSGSRKRRADYHHHTNSNYSYGNGHITANA